MVSASGGLVSWQNVSCQAIASAWQLQALLIIVAGGSSDHSGSPACMSDNQNTRPSILEIQHLLSYIRNMIHEKR